MTEYSNFDDLKVFFQNSDLDRPTRQASLQGWRGADLQTALDAGHATRLAPAVCGALGLATAASGSASLAFATAATAMIGTFATNHPFETLYNRIAARRGRAIIPRNRAAKRLACALATVFFVGAGVGFATDHGAIGVTLAAAVGALATFVAVSNICVPSVIFVLLFGEKRSTAPALFQRSEPTVTTGAAA